MRGMQAFMKARCNQCHAVAGHGVNLGPDLSDVAKRYKGEKLLQQIIEPSSEINDKYRTHQFVMTDGRSITGVVMKDDPQEYQILTNLLTPNTVTRLRKKDVEEKIASKISPMPDGLVNVLTREEILDMLSFLEVGYKLPDHLKHDHSQHQPEK